MKTILQGEAAECSIACLAMICSAYALHVDMYEMRRRFNLSLTGITLDQLMRHAASLQLGSRALRLELDEMASLKLPCILHWNMNHFVVLKAVGRKGIVVLDPAVGQRRLPWSVVSENFTGVALELTPNGQFKPATARTTIDFSVLTGKIIGLKRSLLQIFALSLTLQVFAIFAPLLNQLVVDEVFGANDKGLLPVLIAGFALSLLVQTLLSLARSWMLIVLGQNLSLQWFGNVFSHMLRLPLIFFEKRHLGDLLSRIGSINSIQGTLTTRIISVALDALMVLASLIMMMLYSPSMTAIAVAATLVYGALRLAAYRPYREASRERVIMSARSSSHFLETLRAILPLKLFGREDERLARWRNLQVEVQNRDVKTSIMGMYFSSANTFIFGLEDLTVMWMGGMMVMNSGVNGAPAFSIGMFFAFVSYSKQFTSRAASLIDYGIELKMIGLHTERLGEIVLAEPEVDRVPDSDLSHLCADIELRNVSFRYADGERWVLKNISLTIRQGESVALVGASGCGKTTLLKIILGVLAPTEGEVLFGGVGIKQLGFGNYRRMVGTVMQEDMLLSGSIADNIAFFDGRFDEANVTRCARMAAIHDEITAMSMGYFTLVGDMGSSLSGGQKQRVLLARALYKKPKILALDEATSHLDMDNEALIVRKFSELNLTRILVAHRPETIRSARRVIEVGTQALQETTGMDYVAAKYSVLYGEKDAMPVVAGPRALADDVVSQVA